MITPVRQEPGSKHLDQYAANGIQERLTILSNGAIEEQAASIPGDTQYSRIGITKTDRKHRNTRRLDGSHCLWQKRILR